MNIITNLGHGFTRMNTDMVKEKKYICVIRVNPCPKIFKIEYA